jgi:FkbM family methyltransferase
VATTNADIAIGRALKALRDTIFRNSVAQALVRRGARAGLIPQSFYGRIQPYGAHPVTTPAGQTVVYVADKRDILARSVIWPGDWEVTSLRLFSTLARDARWVLDVGAFTGIYSLIAVADSDAAKVVAIEPNSQIVANLRRNIAANRFTDRVKVIEAAVADAPGRSMLSVPEDTTAARIGAGAVGDRADVRLEVQVTTLDLSIGSLPVDLVKMDVEGGEAAALRGATGLIRRHRPHIVVELLTAEAFRETAAILDRFGYKIIRHLGRSGPREVSERVRQDGEANYHFVKPSVSTLPYDD